LTLKIQPEQNLKIPFKQKLIIMTLVKFKKPMYGLSPIWDEFFNRNIHDSFFPSVPTATTPAVNITDDGTGYIIEMALPGVKKEDVNIELNDKFIEISSATKEEREDQQKNYTRREFSLSQFSRRFTLPVDVEKDQISAVHQDGILKITIPRKAELKNSGNRTIQIQ
jgi:HSP20 family protein